MAVDPQQAQNCEEDFACAAYCAGRIGKDGAGFGSKNVSHVVETHHVAARAWAPIAAQLPPTLTAALSGDPGLMFGLTMAAVAAVEAFAIDTGACADAQRVAQHALTDAMAAGQPIAGARCRIAKRMHLRLQRVVARFGAPSGRQYEECLRRRHRPHR